MYITQSLKFLRPVYIGDTVKAIIIVKEVDVIKRRIFFETICKVKSKNVIIGEAEIYVPAKDINLAL